jgi:hypothetical protein
MDAGAMTGEGRLRRPTRRILMSLSLVEWAGPGTTIRPAASQRC